MDNVYTYFSYIDITNDISLDYALFMSTSTTVLQDRDHNYNNLFNALVDTFLIPMPYIKYAFETRIF